MEFSVNALRRLPPTQGLYLANLRTPARFDVPGGYFKSVLAFEFAVLVHCNADALKAGRSSRRMRFIDEIVIIGALMKRS